MEKFVTGMPCLSTHFSLILTRCPTLRSLLLYPVFSFLKMAARNNGYERARLKESEIEGERVEVRETWINVKIIKIVLSLFTVEHERERKRGTNNMMYINVK